jgi:hypothetical protein
MTVVSAPVYTRRHPSTSKLFLWLVFLSTFLPFRARGYSNGPIILTKVVLGKVYNGAARSCPAGYNSASIYQW